MIETLANWTIAYLYIGIAFGSLWTLAIYWPGPFERWMIPHGIVGTLLVTVLWPLFALGWLGIASIFVLLRVGGLHRHV